MAKTNIQRKKNEEIPKIKRKQGGARTEPEPETGTVGTVFPAGTAGTVFQEPKPEPCPNCTERQRSPSSGETVRTKTGTARTVPQPNRNRTELNWGPPDKSRIGLLIPSYAFDKIRQEDAFQCVVWTTSRQELVPAKRGETEMGVGQD